MERQVEGTVLNEDDVLARLANPAGDGVSVPWSPSESAEDEQIERPLQQHRFGGSRHSCSPELLRGTMPSGPGRGKGNGNQRWFVVR